MSDEGRAPRIGYVLKMYPRFSETFVVTEVLAMEHHGADLDIFSLRPPADGRFHESLSRVRAPVTYLPSPGKPLELWQALSDCRALHPSGFDAHMDEILAATPADAYQAVILATAVREREISHLHAHFGSVAAGVARLAARIAGISYSITLHAKDIFHEDVDHAELAARLRDAALCVTVSDFNERYLRGRYGDDTASLIRIYNGIDLEAFAYTRPMVRPRVVVGVGRLVPKKGFHHLIDAVLQLRDRGRPVRLDLVGGGAEETALRAQVAGLGLEDLVTFHGPLTQTEARQMMRGAAALAAPCIVGPDGNRDGLPTAILEGLALGTPVVATPVTGIPEAIVHDRTGLLVPEGDVTALADALEALVEDDALRCRLADAGREHVESHFDANTNGKMLYDVMAQLAPRPQGVAV
ncbi:glycosyltransferase family 4 protein [Nocardioides sp.]|uniref:glycosyltransferase family 4 protein n=1 Tax=Nocardioides sp. TaxID=35761 RepID=UPI00286DD23D|nr:glycosyltransferase family 4 protein [Nocardioides sp.]